MPNLSDLSHAWPHARHFLPFPAREEGRRAAPDLHWKHMWRRRMLLATARAVACGAGDVVSNMDLAPVLEAHRQRRAADKNAIMTLVGAAAWGQGVGVGVGPL